MCGISGNPHGRRAVRLRHAPTTSSGEADRLRRAEDAAVGSRDQGQCDRYRGQKSACVFLHRYIAVHRDIEQGLCGDGCVCGRWRSMRQGRMLHTGKRQMRMLFAHLFHYADEICTNMACRSALELSVCYRRNPKY